MAGDKPSISRRRVLGAAAFLPVAALAAPPSAIFPAADAALWERRLGAYQRIAARATAAAERGWFRAANDLYSRQCVEIQTRFGGKDAAAQSEEACELRRAAFRRVNRAEDIYWRRCTAPMQEAAVALLLTPAPDLGAVRDKVAVMRALQLLEVEMGCDCLEILERDLSAAVVENPVR